MTTNVKVLEDRTDAPPAPLAEALKGFAQAIRWRGDEIPLWIAPMPKQVIWGAGLSCGGDWTSDANEIRMTRWAIGDEIPPVNIAAKRTRDIIAHEYAHHLIDRASNAKQGHNAAFCAMQAVLFLRLDAKFRDGNEPGLIEQISLYDLRDHLSPKAAMQPAEALEWALETALELAPREELWAQDCARHIAGAWRRKLQELEDRPAREAAEQAEREAEQEAFLRAKHRAITAILFACIGWGFLAGDLIPRLFS